MPIALRGEILFEGLPAMSRRDRNELLREVHKQMGRFWHNELLPPHFTRTAKSKYRHKLRTIGYRKKKKKLAEKGIVKGGGEVDNLFTGLLKESLEGVGTVKAYPKRATIRMTGPRYITMRPYRSNQPDKAGEILRVTRGEADEIAKVGERTLGTYVKRKRRKRKKEKI